MPRRSSHSMVDEQRCDVVFTDDNRIFINGTAIGFVEQMPRITVAYGQPTTIDLKLYPTSIVHGDPPNIQDDEGGQRTNMQRALVLAANRKRRKIVNTKRNELIVDAVDSEKVPSR